MPRKNRRNTLSRSSDDGTASAVVNSVTNGVLNTSTNTTGINNNNNNGSAKGSKVTKDRTSTDCETIANGSRLSTRLSESESNPVISKDETEREQLTVISVETEIVGGAAADRSNCLEGCVLVATKVENDAVVIASDDSISSLTISGEIENNASCEVVNSVEAGSAVVSVCDVSKEEMSPNVKQLQYEVESMREKCRQQAEEISRISELNCRLQEDSRSNVKDCCSPVLAEETADIYEVQMAALEKTITQLQRDVDMYRDRVADQDEAAANAHGRLKRELGGRLEKVTRQLESIEKEKEMVVMKYVQSEATVMQLKKSVEEADRKSRDNAREKDVLLNKIRVLSSDKVRLTQSLEAKSSEVGAMQRECEKLREEITSKDIKIKWAQNKMKTEMDAHKETLAKLERTEHKLKETREEAEQIRRDCQEMIRTYQDSEEMRSNSLDIQLRERETELKRERQEKSSKEEVWQMKVYEMMMQELDALKKKHKLSIDENNALTMKLQSLERGRLDYEHNLGKLKELLNKEQQEIVDLHAKLAEMDNLIVQINREKEKVVVGQAEIERLRQSNAELQIDMEACRRKEGELLEFTERLTSKNVSLQSECSCLEAKSQALERELPAITKRYEELEKNHASLMSELNEEQQLRIQETQLLARKLAEKTKALENLNLKLEEQHNENRVLRRKNASTIRELSREVQTLRRRLESYEASRSNVECRSLGSRASSSTSLDTMGLKEPNVTSGGNNSIKACEQHVNENLTEGYDNAVAPVEPTQQMLVERIVKLQRGHARKNEKIEFLEEHVSQLLKELKKKSKLIQHYVMREESGALSTLSMDQNKDGRNKVDLSRRGGIMASLYTNHQADNGLTMELSIEISRKLQAVLEDTLLKNITLKENIKTLGDEIARLSMERRQL